MKKFTFDFNLSAWIQGIEIEAEDYEEAVEKLGRMSAYDLVSEGYVHNFEIKEVDCDYEEDDEDLEFDEED